MIPSIVILAAFFGISVIGRRLFVRSATRCAKLDQGRVPAAAATRLLMENGVECHIMASTAGTYYCARRRIIFLGPDIISRSDADAEMIARHEAAHAVQHAKEPLIVTIGGLMPLIYVLPLLTLAHPLLATLIPYLMIAMIFCRVGIEMEAWLMAFEPATGKPFDVVRWRRLALTGVMSYL